MNMTKKMIYHTYANLKPIKASVLETVRKQTAKVLWVTDKTGSCKCEYCEKESKLENTKHLSKAKCPECGRKLEVRHLWRKHSHYDVDWRVIADSIEENVIVYRYILSTHLNGESHVSECAREVWNFNQNKVYHLEDDYDRKSKKWCFLERERTLRYFRESAIMNHWQENKMCCRQALPLRRTWNSVRKVLPDLKYCSFKGYRKGFYVPSVIREYRNDYKLYEKLEKVGLDSLIVEYMSTYHANIQYWRGQTELTKMLGITKEKLNYLKSYNGRKVELLAWLQGVEEIDAYDRAIRVKLSIGQWKEITRNLPKSERDRNIKYCIKHGLAYTEYARYLGVAKELGYDVTDRSYQYPKDFRKMDNKMSDEWQAKKDAEEEKRLSKQSNKIKKISEGLRKLPELKELLQGSKGFLVYVPESVTDLRREGNLLHNCIGTYIDRVADGKTLLFFIRRLNDPKAPFVAMEYCHGQIIQCRLDHNKAVEKDTKIYQFAEKIADVMRKNNILAA